MTCAQYQFMLGTEEESALAANADLQAHLQTCADCAQFAEEMQAMGQVMAAVRPLPTPSGFADRVRAQVRETEQVKAPSLLARLLGPLRAPAPAVQSRHAFAAAGLIVAALVLLTAMVHPAGTKASPYLKAPTMAQPGVGQPVVYEPPLPERPAGQPHVP